MNYGFIDNTTKSETPNIAATAAAEIAETAPQQDESVNAAESSAAGKKRKAQALPAKWFDIPPEQNTKVYVSNLPNDITEDEFGQLMSKCGLVMKDLKTGKLKLKLYRDSKGEIKGDGLCHYIKVSHFLFFTSLYFI
jgi:RNA recognition motif-containing protein